MRCRIARMSKVYASTDLCLAGLFPLCGPSKSAAIGEILLFLWSANPSQSLIPARISPILFEYVVWTLSLDVERRGGAQNHSQCFVSNSASSSHALTSSSVWHSSRLSRRSWAKSSCSAGSSLCMTAR